MDDRVRRLRAKRLNERVKLEATFFNGVAIANVIILILSPMAQALEVSGWRVLVGGVGALTSHAIAQAVLTLMRSEE